MKVTFAHVSGSLVESEESEDDEYSRKRDLDTDSLQHGGASDWDQTPGETTVGFDPEATQTAGKKICYAMRSNSLKGTNKFPVKHQSTLTITCNCTIHNTKDLVGQPFSALMVDSLQQVHMTLL